MGKNKKAKVEEQIEDDYSSSSEDSDVSMEDLNQQITATFEGRNLEDIDFHGIRQLLLQLFLNVPVDVSEITNSVLNQQGIGSVIKQIPEDDDTDTDDEDENDVLGVTTIFNLSAVQVKPSVRQLLDYFLKKAETHCSGETLSKFTNILKKNENLGFLINERFVNIPPAISVPMLSSLQQEINKKKKKSQEYDFQYFLMLSKTYKFKKDQDESMFTNEEEMLFFTNAECSFEYSISGHDYVSGESISYKKEVIPYRRLMLIPVIKLSDILTQINTLLQT